MTDRLGAPELTTLTALITTDFVRLGSGWPGLSFITYEAWTADDPHARDSAQDPASPICVSGGRSFLVHTLAGFEGAVAQVASALADEAMGELGRPWPQLRSADGSFAVLEAQRDANGFAVWGSARLSWTCRIGQLDACVARLGAVVD